MVLTTAINSRDGCKIQAPCGVDALGTYKVAVRSPSQEFKGKISQGFSGIAAADHKNPGAWIFPCMTSLIRDYITIFLEILIRDKKLEKITRNRIPLE